MLQYISKWLVFPSPCQKPEGIFYFFLCQNLVVLMEILHKSIGWLGLCFHGAFTSQSILAGLPFISHRHWFLKKFLLLSFCFGKFSLLCLHVYLFSFRGNGLPSNLMSLVDLSRMVDFLVKTLTRFYLLDHNGHF